MSTSGSYIIVSTFLSLLSLGIILWMFISGKKLYSSYIMKILIIFFISPFQEDPIL